MAPNDSHRVSLLLNHHPEDRSNMMSTISMLQDELRVVAEKETQSPLVAELRRELQLKEEEIYELRSENASANRMVATSEPVERTLYWGRLVDQTFV